MPSIWLIDALVQFVHDNPFEYTLGVWVVLGSLYAALVAWWPPAPDWTWASVVIGVFFTVAPAAIITNHWTSNPFIASLEIIGFCITGAFMITGQLMLHQLQKAEAELVIQEFRHWQEVERAKMPQN